MDRKRIAFHYLKSDLLVDLISLMPIITVVSNLYYYAKHTEPSTSFDFVKTLRVTRLLRLSKILRLLRDSKLIQQTEVPVSLNPKSERYTLHSTTPNAYYPPRNQSI